MRSVALLRGINVGGNHKIPMADLKTWLESAGFSSITTYIQSGNVVLEHAARTDVQRRVRDAIVEKTGWNIAVVVRSVGEMRAVVAANPYRGVEPTKLHVSFLDTAPTVEDDPANAQRWLPEEFTVIGRDVYLCLPNGMGRSVMAPRLTAIKNATTRNWNTVLKLVQLLDS
ncbi:MAG TPA: DUF1697 domain-containing protein [Acidimicrobiales bacterium]